MHFGHVNSYQIEAVHAVQSVRGGVQALLRSRVAAANVVLPNGTAAALARTDNLIIV